MKKLILLFAVAVTLLHSSCATFFGEKYLLPEQYACQHRKPVRGEAKRQVRPAAVFFDLFLFFPSLGVDFITGDIYKPCGNGLIRPNDTIINNAPLFGKAARVKKRHPNWSDEDCMKIMRNEVWIGMTIEMLRIEKIFPPSSVNVSNYGDGNQYQACWDSEDRSPECYYYGDDGIITSYN